LLTNRALSAAMARYQRRCAGLGASAQRRGVCKPPYSYVANDGDCRAGLSEHGPRIAPPAGLAHALTRNLTIFLRQTDSTAASLFQAAPATGFPPTPPHLAALLRPSVSASAEPFCRAMQGPDLTRVSRCKSGVGAGPGRDGGCARARVSAGGEGLRSSDVRRRPARAPTYIALLLTRSHFRVAHFHQFPREQGQEGQRAQGQ
jgi:hypothetical protein